MSTQELLENNKTYLMHLERRIEEIKKEIEEQEKKIEEQEKD